MPDLSEIAIKGTTQNHLPVEDIKKNLVILKNGNVIMILKTSSVNFDLLSQKEQDAMIYAYASLLNSLTFPIQILIRSSLKDVSNYVKRLEQQKAKITDPLLKKQVVSYLTFVQEVVEKNNVLAKSFYIVIPFYAAEAGLQAAAQTSLPFPLNLISQKGQNQGFTMDKNKLIKKAQSALEPKKEHLKRLLGRLGLSTDQLDNKKLIQLFYQIYNQESILVDNIKALSQQSAVIRKKDVKFSQSTDTRSKPKGGKEQSEKKEARTKQGISPEKEQ